MNSTDLEASADALRALAGLDRDALVSRWTSIFNSPAPRNAHLALLQGALAWHEQIGREGAANVRQLIRRLHRQAGSPASVAVLAPGTRLLREWQGQTHHVAVLADGFEYDGKTYRSLTAISRQITGTAWSGPLFFGLRS